MKINLKEKITTKVILSSVVILILLIAMIFSAVCYGIKTPGKRRTFVFPSTYGKENYIEVRYLQSVEGKSDIEVFIDDLLLGSSLERTKKLFTLGTKINSCMKDGNVLYLDLSDDLILMGTNVVSIKEGMDLLEQNVRLNFPEIHQVEFFINGKYAFENSKKLEISQ